MTASGARRFLRPWLLGLGVALGLGYLALVVAANEIVKRSLSGLDEGKLSVSASHTWTWFPPRIALENLTVADQRAGWVIQTDHVSLRLSLLRLLQGRIVIQTARAPIETAVLEHRLLHSVQRSSRAVLGGGMMMHASGVRYERGIWRVDAAEVTLQGSALSVDAGTIAFVHGQVSLADGGARVTIHLRGSSARTAPTAWTLQATTKLGATKPLQAELSAERPWTWSSERWELRFGRSSTLSVRGDTRDGFDFDLRVPELTVKGAPGKVTGQNVRVRYHEPSPSQAGGSRVVNMRGAAQNAVFEPGAALDSFRSPVSATLDVRREPEARWGVTSATVTLPRVTPSEPAQAGIAPLSIRFVTERDQPVESQQWSNARVHIDGAQLGAIFGLLPLPAAARLLVSPFEGQRFEAQGKVIRDGSRLRLEEVTLTSPRLHGSGFVHFDRTSTRGALLVSVPLGALGLSFARPGTGEARWNPSADWLSRQERAASAAASQ